MPIFNLAPTMGTYLSGAYACGIFENPCIPSLFLNWNIQLTFPLNWHRRRYVRLDYYPRLTLRRYYVLGALNAHSFKHEMALILQSEKLTKTVSNYLRAGWYILADVDYFYIKGTSQYFKKHYRYNCLFFNEKNEPGTFVGALYAKGQKYRAITVPHGEFLQAFLSSASPNNKTYQPRLIAIRPSTIPRDVNEIKLDDLRLQCAHYLHGTALPITDIDNHHIRSFCEADRKDTTNYAFGVNVHNQLKEYFYVQAQSKYIRYDRRITRLFYEHKMLMSRRLARISKKWPSLPREFFFKWQEIEQLSYWMHLKGIAASQRNDQSLLASLGEDVSRIKSLESKHIESLLHWLSGIQDRGPGKAMPLSVDA